MKIHEPRPQVSDLLRQTRAQLVSFSQMADTKANILLSIASVLLSISLSKATDPSFTLSIITLIVFLLITIFLALLTVIPNFQILPHKKRSTNDYDYNPLFFGDYADIPFDEYVKHFEQIMNDSNQTYELMLKEIYYAGVYLQKTKYNYIKYAYISFFIGLIASTGIYLVQNFL